MDQWRTFCFKCMLTLIVLLCMDQPVSAEDHPQPDGSPRLISRSAKAASCDCNSQGPWLPIFKPSASIKPPPSSPLSYLSVAGPDRFHPDSFHHISHDAPNNLKHIGHIKHGGLNSLKHIGQGSYPDSFNHIRHGSPNSFNPDSLNHIKHVSSDSFDPDILNHIKHRPDSLKQTVQGDDLNHIGQYNPDSLNDLRQGTPDSFNDLRQGTPDSFNHIGQDNLDSLKHTGQTVPDSFNSIEPAVPGSFNPASTDDTGNRHMIHVHLIPHLYVPIVNQAGGSEDHKIQENHFAHPSSSAELPAFPEKHIDENHIVENHYDEFGNPYDPNQSAEVDEDDDGEITNVDIHTYSSDDQGGSSHTHYTKNNGVSYESYEQTAPSGTGEVAGDHGAQSSSYEKSNSYYTIPPNANIHHYNMHSEYNNLLSKEPSLHDLTDYPPKPYKQYEVHENTGEDTTHNNLAPTPEPSTLNLPQLSSSTPSVNEIETNHLNIANSLSPSNRFRYPFGKQNPNPSSGFKSGKHLGFPLSFSGQHDSNVKMIMSPNIQLEHNQNSREHYSLISKNSKPRGQDMKTHLDVYGGHFPIKSISLNSEQLPAISLDSNKGNNNNLMFINEHDPFNRMKFNKFVPLNSIKSTPPKLNYFPHSNQLEDNSYFKSKDYLKPLYSFKHLPALQPLFSAEPSDSNHMYLTRANRNFHMMKLKPQILADYSVSMPNRQNHVRHLIMNREYDVSKMRPPPPAQKPTWNEPSSSYQQIIPDSYAKITLPKSVYHVNLLRTPVLASSNIGSRLNGSS